MKECLEWAYKKNIHVISDEIYAISIFEGYKLNTMAQIWLKQLEDPTLDADYLHYLENYVHIVGGLSKDFGISGFRVGIIYTRNQDIMNISFGFQYLHQCSHQT